jgi:hypothetical protein
VGCSGDGRIAEAEAPGIAGSSVGFDLTASGRAAGEVEPVRVFESAEAAMVFLSRLQARVTHGSFSLSLARRLH